MQHLPPVFSLAMFALLGLIFLVASPPQAECVPLHRVRRAFSYIANETACKVDHIVYREGDPVPTDDPCETCRCRPPGFSCVLRDCEVKSGCRAIRRIGECCPQYQCGCEHNGKYYRDGDRVPNAESPCYSCYCQGSSITCSLADCMFRFDCEPDYVAGECCPRYDHCPPDEFFVTVKSTEIPRLTTTFFSNHSSTTPMTTVTVTAAVATSTTTEEPVMASLPISPSSTVGQAEEPLNGTAAVSTTTVLPTEATAKVNASSISVDSAQASDSAPAAAATTTLAPLVTEENISALTITAATDKAPSAEDYLTAESPTEADSHSRSNSSQTTEAPASADAPDTTVVALETTESSANAERSTTPADIDLSLELATSAVTKSDLNDSSQVTTAVSPIGQAATSKDLYITTTEKQLQLAESTTGSPSTTPAADTTRAVNESVDASNGAPVAAFVTDASSVQQSVANENATTEPSLSSFEATTPDPSESQADLSSASREAEVEFAVDHAPVTSPDTEATTVQSEAKVNESDTIARVAVDSVTESANSEQTTINPVTESEITVTLESEFEQRRNQTVAQMNTTTTTTLEATTETPQVTTTTPEVNLSITLSSEAAAPVEEAQETTTTGSAITA